MTIPAWCGWGVHALPLSLYLPSRAKLWCTLQLRGHITEQQKLLSGVHSIMRVKLAQAGEGGGVHAHPLSLHLPSSVKLQCTLQLSGQIHQPCFISSKNMYSVGQIQSPYFSSTPVCTLCTQRGDGEYLDVIFHILLGTRTAIRRLCCVRSLK